MSVFLMSSHWVMGSVSNEDEPPLAAFAFYMEDAEPAVDLAAYSSVISNVAKNPETFLKLLKDPETHAIIVERLRYSDFKTQKSALEIINDNLNNLSNRKPEFLDSPLCKYLKSLESADIKLYGIVKNGLKYLRLDQEVFALIPLARQVSDLFSPLDATKCYSQFKSSSLKDLYGVTKTNFKIVSYNYYVTAIELLQNVRDFDTLLTIVLNANALLINYSKLRPEIKLQYLEKVKSQLFMLIADCRDKELVMQIAFEESCRIFRIYMENDPSRKDAFLRKYKSMPESELDEVFYSTEFVKKAVIKEKKKGKGKRKRRG